MTTKIHHKFVKIPNGKQLKNKNLQQNIKSYLQEYFDLDQKVIDMFLLFLNKDMLQKHELYKNKSFILFSNDELDYALDYSDTPTSNLLKTRNPRKLYYPDLEFETQMTKDFEDFRQILLQDQQEFLYQSVKIDDFYRLFAPYYQPMF